MIDAVEELYTEEQQAYYEACSWEELRASLRHLLCEVDDSRHDSIRETHDAATPEYDKLEAMLEEVEDYVNGRIEELNPGSYRHYMGFNHYATREELEVLNYALLNGVNGVAVLQMHTTSRQLDAIDYVRERGLASLNYEATKEAVSAYESQRGVIAWQ